MFHSAFHCRPLYIDETDEKQNYDDKKNTAYPAREATLHISWPLCDSLGLLSHAHVPRTQGDTLTT